MNDDVDCPSHMGNYDWCGVDANLLTYINSGDFIGKKIVLIIWGAPEQATSNTVTPPYVFSAGTLDVAVCHTWQGNVGTNTCPIEFANGKSAIAQGEYGIWAYSATNTKCLTSTGAVSIQCNPGCSSVSSSGFPVVYETQFMTNYQNFLGALATHYNVNTGSHNGAKIAPYIAYVRVGMASGGENQAFCTTAGNLDQTPNEWFASTTFPVGYVVYSGNSQYVAIGTGQSGSGTMPTCSPAGCITGPDNTIPGWYNAGTYASPPPSTNNAIWPGIHGEFSSSPERNGYKDNGYLSMWPPVSGPSDGPGYTALMLSFLQTLHASFPFTISAHTGPPANQAISYANSEAAQASFYGMGFGMESLNIGDAQLYVGAGGSAPQFPTSQQDWVNNVRNFPAPVHPLQTFYPGNLNSNPNGVTNRAAGFPISTISATSSGTSELVTVLCVSDCIPFANPTETPIYISGNSNPIFNGVWIACAVSIPPPSCVSGVNGSGVSYLQFSAPSITGTPSGSGGIVWAPDYFPVIIPFAVQHGATAIELYECDLDYAYGGTSSETTNWVHASSGLSGCVIPDLYGTVTSPVPYTPDDLSYQNSILGALIGQPRATSIRTGNSILLNGQQF